MMQELESKLQEEKAYSDDLLRSRDQLISTVSHDLKTPLNTIVGYSELFTHTPLSEKQKSYTRQIGSSAHFISRLVDDLLDFSKLEAGKLPIDYVPFSLESLIRKTAKASQDIHIDKDLALKVYIDGGQHVASTLVSRLMTDLERFNIGTAITIDRLAQIQTTTILDAANVLMAFRTGIQDAQTLHSTFAF